MDTSRSLLGVAVLVTTIGVGGCDDTPAAPAEGSPSATSRQVGEELEEARWPEMEFDELAIFLEFNATDDDLGVQVFLDAEEWSRLTARAPNGRPMLDFKAEGRLGDLGLTELRFESAEPSPAEVLSSIRAGEYSFRGRTVDGGRLVGEATLSHALPPAPVITAPSGASVDPSNTVVEWDAVAGVDGYEVIVADEETEEALEVRLGADVTSLHVPPEFLRPDTEYKVEVLAIAENGNKTITEVVFSTAP